MARKVIGGIMLALAIVSIWVSQATHQIEQQLAASDKSAPAVVTRLRSA